MEYKVVAQFNKELATYVAVVETLNITSTGDSLAESVARAEIKYLELIEKASLNRTELPPKEELVMVIPNMDLALTEERNLVLQKDHDKMLISYNKQKELMTKILNSSKTPEEKLALFDKLSKA